MKQYEGNLLAYFNDGSKAGQAGTSARHGCNIQMIDVHDIAPNPRNFYSVENIEQLAASMAFSGHVAPLEVVPSEKPGKYTLLSGERRRAAVLYRLDRGEIHEAAVPCIVREDMREADGLTADELETINLITANDYRTKTPFDRLAEVQQLRPIARKVWLKRKQMDTAELTEAELDPREANSFRTFYAEEFLGISSSSLQRILVYEKLVPEARAAYEDGLLGKSALAELACNDEEAQHEYLAALRKGLVGNTMKDAHEAGLRKWLSDAQASEADEDGQCVAGKEELSFEPETIAANVEGLAEDGAEVAEQQAQDSGQTLMMEQTRAAAGEWVKEEVLAIIAKAEAKVNEAKQDGNEAEAASWDLRREAAAELLECLK